MFQIFYETVDSSIEIFCPLVLFGDINLKDPFYFSTNSCHFADIFSTFFDFGEYWSHLAIFAIFAFAKII